MFCQKGVFVFFLLIFLAYVPAQAAPYDYMIVFGDSHADTDNRRDISLTRPPSPPNWRGRPSTGPVGAELLSELIGIAPARTTNYAISAAGTGELLVPSSIPGSPFADYNVSENIKDLPCQITRFLERTGAAAQPGREKCQVSIEEAQAGLTIRPVGDGVDEYIQRVGRAERPPPAQTLILLKIGGNDFSLKGVNVVAENGVCAGEGMTGAPRAPNGCWSEQSLPNIIRQMRRLAEAGYRNFAIDSLDDFGIIPSNRRVIELGCARELGSNDVDEECRALFTRASNVANAALAEAVRALGEEIGLNIIWLDANDMLTKEIHEDPAAYGLRNTRDPSFRYADPSSPGYATALAIASVCGGSQGEAAPQDVASSDDADYLWADCVHRTAAGHVIWAEYAASVINTPTQLAFLGHALLDIGQAGFSHAHRHLSQGAHRLNGFYADYMFDAFSYEGSPAGRAFDKDVQSLVIGFDAPFAVKQDRFLSGFAWGTAVYFLFGNIENDDGTSADMEGEIFLTHLTLDSSDRALTWFNMFSYSLLDFDDIQRNTGFYDRIAEGATEGKSYQLSSGLAHRADFLAGSFGRLELGQKTGIFWQRGDLRAYNERGADSLDMRVGARDVESLQVYYGLNIAHRFFWRNHFFHSSAGVTYRHDFFDDPGKSSARSYDPDGQPRSSDYNRLVGDLTYPDYGYTPAGVGGNLYRFELAGSWETKIGLILDLAASFDVSGQTDRQSVIFRLRLPIFGSRRGAVKGLTARAGQPDFDVSKSSQFMLESALF